MSKIKKLGELKEIVESLKNEGKTIVTTNGAFDIIHFSHINLLQKVKKLGDISIVLINGDSSPYFKTKGPKRPISPEKERAGMLAALECVDYIAIFNEDKPLRFLEELKPHIHSKGYQGIAPRNAEEEKLVNTWGGKLMLVNSGGTHSTTDIIKKILATAK